MEKNIKQILLEFKKNKSADEINNYFATDFHRDFAPRGGVLEFLHEEFYAIDVDYYDSPDFEDRVFAVIDRAIEMLEQKGDNHGER